MFCSGCVTYSGSHGIVTNSKFQNCTGGAGALAYTEKKNQGEVNGYISNTIFYKNSVFFLLLETMSEFEQGTQYGGGLAMLSNGLLHVEDSQFIQNEAINGAGAFFDRGNITFNNCLFARNIADTCGVEWKLLCSN